MGIDGGSLPSLYTPLPPIPGALESDHLCSPAYFSLLCLRLATLYLCVRLMSSFVLVHIVAYHSVSRLVSPQLDYIVPLSLCCLQPQFIPRILVVLCLQELCYSTW